jgi:hypothetical protein
MAGGREDDHREGLLRREESSLPAGNKGRRTRYNKNTLKLRLRGLLKERNND